MSDPAKAVFLSYASQDAEAARRICEALRAAGVEVWFDQSELVGGDAWDAKIKKQIQTCALFVPIISASTQAREEGYFRREWNLAVNRTLDMAHDKAFLLPVVIDATADAVARVPEKFREVQWTRISSADSSAAFCERVKQLLEGSSRLETNDPVSAPQDSNATRASTGAEGVASAAKRRSPSWFVPTIIALVAAGVALALFVTRRPPAPPPSSAAAQPTSDLAAKSVAVLPFENFGGEATNVDFADGMHDEVITALAKIAALKVIGRTSVLPYRDPTQRNLRKVAADLNVGSVVEGTVRRFGNRVRIGVKLIDAQSSRQLWGDTYEKELTDVFAIQSAVAQEIATTLRATFTAGERAQIERRPTENVRAYELYLQAKLLTNALTNNSPLKDWERAVQMLEQAVAIDPGFAQAFALLARNQIGIYWYGTLDPSPARRELARQALSAAQRLAPAAPETRFAEGRFAYASNRNFAEAMRHYQAALVEAPNDSALVSHLGLTHRQLGHHVEAASAMARAYELNPQDLFNATDLVASCLMLRRFADGVRFGERYDGRSPDSSSIIRFTTFARYELDGDRAQFFQRLRSRTPSGHDLHGLIPLYETALLAGQYAEAAQLLSDPRFVPLLSVGNTIAEPVALHRAWMARLLDRREEAAKHAAAATAELQSRAWTPRQQPVVALALVRAAAYAGRDAEAIQLAANLRREIGAKNGIDEIGMLGELSRVYVLVGAREEAISLLRTLMTGPSSPYFGTPRILRLDPCWSRLADDPRFEEILKAAKAL